jgi:hypothetical protein
MVMIYIPSDVPLHKEQEYVWFRGRDFNGFYKQDIQTIPHLWGRGGDPRGHINVLHILPVTFSICF